MVKNSKSFINEAPYQIFGPHPHASSDSKSIEIGKPYKDRKRARNRAEKLNREIGGHRYTVKKVEEDSLTEGEKFISSRNRPHVDRSINRLIGRAKTHIKQAESQSQRKFASFRPAVQRKKNYHYDQAQKFTNFVGRALNALDKSYKDENARRDALFKEDAIIDYLVTEGYVDDYDSAIMIYESMSDEWLIEIYKDLNEGFVDLTPEKMNRVERRVGEINNDMKASLERAKKLRNRMNNPFRSKDKIKGELRDIQSKVHKKHKLTQNAVDSIVRTRAGQLAASHKRTEDIKNKIKNLRDHYENI